jgi:hypothetical protein
MRAEFEAQRVQLQHRGLTGRAREATLAAEYLEKYLPRTVQLRRNVELVSTDGQISPECDLVICDATTPPLWTSGDVEVLPIECVYAVIEVKSRLDGTELEDAWRKIRAIKAMPKVAWYPSPIQSTIRLYGREWTYMPVQGFVFAYESVNLERLADRLLSRAIEDRVPPQHCIDGVYVLEAGSLHWGDETQFWMTAVPGKRTVRFIRPLQGRSVLPIMTLNIQALMSMTTTPRFDFGAYMGNMVFGSSQYMTDGSHFPTETDATGSGQRS